MYVFLEAMMLWCQVSRRLDLRLNPRPVQGSSSVRDFVMCIVCTFEKQADKGGQALPATPVWGGQSQTEAFRTSLHSTLQAIVLTCLEYHLRRGWERL